ncbi:MAG: BMP family ABC transporter substrate-binding protein [Candidatus Cloacimonetes bacterium]|nr:BMP family ABC transporter substrate-binding protein [Candidatus Cloacimonadota bacterium]MCF7815088.1 BMP family ABC transporter substrate-binding protein [Candidatus Cloacimonadota bacterium]MCF7869312.1 BMP family ABC transporter substrate-binding protein [Candidatus Cloacimonadota bacterium]MCF7884736.1 BMP family ABC transporter substrate-binding protein [Candidatus Cloacimonadota bacterium]
MNKFVIILLVVLMILIFSCTKSEKTDQIKIAMCTDVGGVNDQSFNQSAWEGLQRAEKDFGIKASYLESNQDADYKPNMETLLDAGNDLIAGIGFKMKDLMVELSKLNPEQKYAGIDCWFDSPSENLVGVNFKEQEPSYLVGYIAGKMSKTGKVGFVGGMDFPVIHKFHYGFLAGVKRADPNCEILVQYADSFTDAAKGKAIANQMYKNGADIIFHAAGAVGDGVIESAKEQNKFAIGVDRDQNHLAPDNVLTSAMKRVDNAMYNLTKLLVSDEFPGGSNVIYGLKEGGVGIAPTTDKLVPQEILNEVKTLEGKIISGEIIPPASKNEWDAIN